MTEPVYLDYNATAPIRPQALEACRAAMVRPHNASSVHSYGREARKIIEDARIQVAALCGVPAGQIIFNSGATEGNNTVLKFFSGERVLVSAIEHPSVLEAAPQAEKIAVTKDGVIDLGALETFLKNKPKAALVSIMLVNNETGAIQPVAEAARMAKNYGALVHCDAVQAAGRIPINMNELGIDFLTLSAHKIGGPQGVGALIMGICGITPRWLDGGGQEKKARAGTENVAGIAGFGEAAQCAANGLADPSSMHQIQEWRDKLENALLETSANIVIHSRNTPRVANTSLFSLPGVSSETLLMAFDLEGIALSNGSACASGSVRPSPVLKAMNVPDDIAAGTLRVSMGWNTKESDIDRFLEIWSKISQRIKDKKKAHA